MRSIHRWPIAALFITAACATTQAPAPQLIPQLRQADVAGGQLSYRVVGRGEPVLLIHGAVFADAFVPLLTEPALSAYRLIQYHRRGYGGSARVAHPFTMAQQAADAVAVLDRLGIRKAHIAGHSYGGAIALQIARDHPDRVASLILLEPGLFEMTPAAQAFFGEVGAALQVRATAGDRAALTRFVASVAGPDALERGLARPGGEAAFEQAVADAPTFFDVEMPAAQTWNYTFDDVRKVSVPVLAVVGGNTIPVFHETHANVRKSLPQSEELIVQGATHELQLTHASQVAEGIAAFLNRHPVR